MDDLALDSETETVALRRLQPGLGRVFELWMGKNEPILMVRTLEPAEKVGLMGKARAARDIEKVVGY